MSAHLLEAPDGVNHGAGRIACGPLGFEPSRRSTAPAMSRSRRRRVDPAQLDPADCEHRHWFRRWKPLREHAGFDPGTMRVSQAQLVARGEQRELELRWDQFHPVQVFSDRPDLASVVAAGDSYRISGLAQGDTAVHAMNGRGLCESMLAVVVRDRIDVPIVFHHVRDLQRPDYRCGTPTGDLVREVNRIFEPQACLHFHEQTIADPVFDHNRITGQPLDFGPTGIGGRGFEIFPLRALDFPAAVNVFLVWRLAHQDGPIGGAHVGDCVFLSAQAGDAAGRRLAHEIGHRLTQGAPASIYPDEDGHTVHPDKLMDPQARGIWISLAEATLMHAQAAALVR